MTEEPQHRANGEPDPFEAHIAKLIAAALGERKVRFNDRRMLIIYLATVALGIAFVIYVQYAFSISKDSCEHFNGFIDRVQTSVENTKALPPEERRQRVAFYEGAKQTCPPSLF